MKRFLLAFALLTAALLISKPVYARDNGQYENVDPKIREWIEHLRNDDGKGTPCCEENDGLDLKKDAVDFDLKNNHYRVFLRGKWRDVTTRALIKEPNRVGRAIVWYTELNGPGDPVWIVCFLPGPLG